MDICPVSAIRPVPMVNPARAKRELAAVREVELRDGEQDGTYSRSQRQAFRGLEDEESDLETGGANSGFSEGDFVRPADDCGGISFFA